MPEKQSKTKKPPVERASQKDLERQSALFNNNKIFKSTAEAVSQMLVILNKQRQIVYANQMFLDLLGILEHAAVVGKRTGEAIACMNSVLTGDCGNSEFCRTCGSLNAILESHTGEKSINECRIITFENDALDFRVKATPYYHEDEMFTIFAINDISHEKRRQTLERVFFHDVLNTAGGILGLSNILQNTSSPNDVNDIVQMINRSTESLIDDIEAQHQLTQAERNDYHLNFKIAGSLEILKQIAELYSRLEIAENENVEIDPQAQNFILKTDVVLLKRVLGNMLKNALEASAPGQSITLNCIKFNNRARFSVHNSSFIERKNQLQLFKRSFSTKGSGRGIGTYSMKLFGEKYLKGNVWFESTREKGTTFYVEIPA